MTHKNRLVLDLCTPAAERRPTTKKDIEHDLQVRNYDSFEDPEAELFNDLLDLAELDWEELFEEFQESDKGDENSPTYWDDYNEFFIKRALKALEDIGDGTPNIQYLAFGGKVYTDLVYPYYYFKEANVDFDKATKKQLVKIALANEEVDEDEDLDESLFVASNENNIILESLKKLGRN